MQLCVSSSVYIYKNNPGICEFMIRNVTIYTTKYRFTILKKDEPLLPITTWMKVKKIMSKVSQREKKKLEMLY